MPTPSRRTLSWPWLLAGLTALAALVRLPGLGRASLWVDECYTLQDAIAAAHASPAALFAALMRGFSSSSLLLAPWAGPAISETALRLPSAIAGVLLVPVLAMLGRALAGPAAGAWAGLFAALSPYLVWHAREARWYSLTWLLAAAGACFWVRALRRRRPGDAAWTAALGVSAASVWSPAIVLAAIELPWLAVVALRRRLRGGSPGGDLIDVPRPSGSMRRALRNWPASLPSSPALALCAGACAAGAWWTWQSLLLPALRGGAAGFGFHNLAAVRAEASVATAAAWSAGYTLGPGPLEWHAPVRTSPAPAVALVLVSAIVALGFLAARGFAVARRATPGPAWGFAILAAAPLAAIAAASVWTGHAYAPRYAGLSYLFVLCLAAAGAAGPPRDAAAGHRAVSSRGWRLRAAAAAATAVLLIADAASLWNLHARTRYEREDVRSAARHVRERAAPAETVLIVGGIEEPWRHYYAGAAAWSQASARFPLWPWTWLETDAPAARPDLWIVEGRAWEAASVAPALDLLRAGTRVKETAHFHGVTVTRLGAPGDDSSAPPSTATRPGSQSYTAGDFP